MNRRDFVLSGLAAIGFAAALPRSAAAAPEKGAAPLEVTYYYLPT